MSFTPFMPKPPTFEESNPVFQGVQAGQNIYAKAIQNMYAQKMAHEDLQKAVLANEYNKYVNQYAKKSIQSEIDKANSIAMANQIDAQTKAYAMHRNIAFQNALAQHYKMNDPDQQQSAPDMNAGDNLPGINKDNPNLQQAAQQAGGLTVNPDQKQHLIQAIQQAQGGNSPAQQGAPQAAPQMPTQMPQQAQPSLPMDEEQRAEVKNSALANQYKQIKDLQDQKANYVGNGQGDLWTKMYNSVVKPTPEAEIEKKNTGEQLSQFTDIGNQSSNLLAQLEPYKELLQNTSGSLLGPIAGHASQFGSSQVQSLQLHANKLMPIINHLAGIPAKGWNLQEMKTEGSTAGNPLQKKDTIYRAIYDLEQRAKLNLENKQLAGQYLQQNHTLKGFSPKSELPFNAPNLIKESQRNPEYVGAILPTLTNKKLHELIATNPEIGKKLIVNYLDKDRVKRFIQYNNSLGGNQ